MRLPIQPVAHPLRRHDGIPKPAAYPAQHLGRGPTLRPAMQRRGNAGRLPLRQAQPAQRRRRGGGDKIGRRLPAQKFRAAQARHQKIPIMRQPLHLAALQRPRQQRRRLPPGRRMGDNLGNHRIEMVTNHAARFNPRIHPHPGRRIRLPHRHRAGGWQKIPRRILRAQPRLNRMPADGQIRLGVAQRLPLGDAQLLAHQIQPGNRLGHRVFHLQARVHLQKEELPPRQQKLRRAGGIVGNPAGHRQRRRPHLRPQRSINCGGRRLLDNLLMPPLDGAFTLEHMHQIAVPVAQQLHLHMPRAHQIAFQKHRAIAKRRQRLTPGTVNRRRQPVRRRHYPHAAPTTAGRRLDQHRIADLCRRRLRIIPHRQRMRLQGRHPRRLRHRLGR